MLYVAVPNVFDTCRDSFVNGVHHYRRHIVHWRYTNERTSRLDLYGPLNRTVLARVPSRSVVGSSQGIAPPRLPRIRTCRFSASGSSVHGSLRNDCRTDVGLRQRVTRQKLHHHVPRYPSPLRAAT